MELRRTHKRSIRIQVKRRRSKSEPSLSAFDDSLAMSTRILQRALRTQTRLLSTKPAPPPPPPDYLAQINLASSQAGSSERAHVGPFPLPPGGDRDAQVRAAGKKWRELNGAQKVGVAATQTSSLLVVLAGGGLAALVLYATGTELWSEASPTRIFEDCVERVRASEEVRSLLSSPQSLSLISQLLQIQSMLLPPLSFHGANSSNRLRRNRRISHSLTTDADGTERMLVRFWVEGQVPDNGEEKYWFDTVKEWIGPLIWEDSTRPGSYVPQPTHLKPAPPPPSPPPPQTWGGWIGGGLSSVFGGLVPRTKVGEDGQPTTGSASLFKRARKPHLGEFSTGEAVAELKKVCCHFLNDTKSLLTLTSPPGPRDRPLRLSAALCSHPWCVLRSHKPRFCSFLPLTQTLGTPTRTASTFRRTWSRRGRRASTGSGSGAGRPR